MNSRNGDNMGVNLNRNAIHFLAVNGKIVSYFGKFNGLLFLMIEEFDGSFLLTAFLIERDCVYICVNLRKSQSNTMSNDGLNIEIIGQSDGY